MWAASSSGEASTPARSATTAATRWPNRSSGTPTTRASNTAGWPLSTPSTSSGKTFSPPVLMLDDPRPSTSIDPSAATMASSPATAQRTPSTTGNVAAVRSGSPQ